MSDDACTCGIDHATPPHVIDDLLAAGFTWRDWELKLSHQWMPLRYVLHVWVPNGVPSPCSDFTPVDIYSIDVPDEGPYGLWLIQKCAYLEQSLAQ